MQRPIILEGKPFDWDEGGKNMLNAVDKDGNVNWRAAMSADPGVMRCPSCDEYLWKEGKKVKCPKCSLIFEVLI
jgi:Zn finger protein HypA/HybF involved in hydrogenase expression